MRYFKQNLKKYQKLLIILFIFNHQLIFANTEFMQNYSNNIINISNAINQYCLIINKSKSLIDVISIESPEKFTLVDSYELIPLSNTDNKVQSNDKNFPEGIYYINEIIKVNDYNKPEEIIALVMNYPNDADIIQKRTGSNIWIQNYNNKIQQNHSCFYLKTQSLNSLRKYIIVDRTPIIIIHENTPITMEKQSTLKNKWNNLLIEWKDSFNSKHLVSHFNMYVSTQNDHNIEYSQTINSILRRKSTEGIYFTIENIILFSTPQEIQAKFTFNFNSPTYNKNGNIILTFVPIGSSWKIINERFYQITRQDDEIQLITNFIEKWKESWINKNIKKFMSFYDSDFNDGLKNYREYYDYKKNTFKRAEPITIGISSMQINKNKDYLWEITFIQKYTSGMYSDKGKKTIMLKGKDGGFKIISETWEKID